MAKPEVLLAAARLACPENEWEVAENVAGRTGAWCTDVGDWFDLDDNPAYYRALREVLDKKYGITIWWNRYTNEWLSMSDRGTVPIRGWVDDDITNLMMKIVVELVEAGVVE